MASRQRYRLRARKTLIDKVILEQLYDPMTHLVNNSITHGIETPEERSAQNKFPVGQITIRAFFQGNQTVISVADDGAGMTWNGLKQRQFKRA
jgi:chemosensory pili system protein ChpA (sensor histidine kinase/response regulator)